MGHDTQNIWFRRYSKLLCFATLALIFIGGMVTSTNSGLSVPDWPTTYGQNMFTFPISKWQGGIFYEHGHRLVASAVGFLTLVMAIWLPFVERRDWVRFLGFAALSAVILQGLLGGLTVLMKLPPAVSILHGVLAQTFFVFTILLAYSQSLERRRRIMETEQSALRAVARASVALAALIYVQLILGAIMRHTNAGLAVPDFPTMGGSWIPSLDEVNTLRATMGFTAVTMSQMLANLSHRVGAVAVTFALIVLNVVTLRRRNMPDRVRSTIYFLDALLLLQIGLGASTIWTRKAPVIASLHVAVGASLLGLSTLLALRALPVRPAIARERKPAELTELEAQTA